MRSIRLRSDYQGCGLGLDASVSRPSRSAVVPRLGLSPRLKFQTPGSRLGLETERLCLGLSLDTEGLGLGLGIKRLGLVGKHFSIMIEYAICQGLGGGC